MFTTVVEHDLTKFFAERMPGTLAELAIGCS